MKKFIFLGILTISSSVFSQVGINTPSPNATLDVTGTPNNLNATDGMIAPRITGNELKLKDPLYGANQTATLLYVTAAASPTTTKTANVTEAGYYYFDGAKWTNGNFWRLSGNAGTTTGTNFLGTTDAQNLMFKVNNVESGYIQRSTTSTAGFDYKTSYGYNAGAAITTGDDNSLFGARSGAALTAGARNTAIGSRSLSSTTTGNDNTAVGAYTLALNTSGTRNMAFGSNALFSNTTGSNNIAIGDTSLNSLNSTASATYNTALGQSSLAGMKSGTGNTAIGASTQISDDLTNATAIGYNASATQSNSLILGSTGAFGVNVGIGTTAPKTKLHITSGDVYLETIGNGVIMKSPDGNCWRVTVDNSGSFSSASISCP